MKKGGGKGTGKGKGAKGLSKAGKHLYLNATL